MGQAIALGVQEGVVWGQSGVQGGVEDTRQSIVKECSAAGYAKMFLNCTRTQVDVYLCGFEVSHSVDYESKLLDHEHDSISPKVIEDQVVSLIYMFKTFSYHRNYFY